MIDGNALLNELESITYAEVCANYSESIALKCCGAMCLCLHMNFNDCSMYIAKTDKEHLNNDYNTIFNEFKDRNYKDLALKYGRSEQSIYHIIKVCTARHVRARQNDLFPLPCDVMDKKPISQRVVEEYLPREFVGCGVSKEDAAVLGLHLSQHLIQMFPGISVVISHKVLVKHQRDGRQGDLFT